MPEPTVTSIATPAPIPPSEAPPSATSIPTPVSTSPAHRRHAPGPSRAHVLLVMLENKGYAATLGSCSADPYLCSLASHYLSATAWEGIGHPSLPNYLAITSGSTQRCSSDGCSTGIRAADLGGQLTSAGIPWDAYMESMPMPCYSGAMSGEYTRVHNPFVYYAGGSSPCHDDPYPGSGGLVAVLDSPTPPDFVWLSPNLGDDMHSGSVEQGDTWLRSNLAPVFASRWFTGSNATVIVTMDENDPQSIPAGGFVPMVVISARATGLGPTALQGNHYGTLRSIEEAFSLPLLGSAQELNNGDVVRYFG
jgi:phosphatidylinositol-3-phosphatase